METYGADLSRAVDAIAKQLAGISMQAQHDMILDERSDPDVVLAYTGKLVERVEGLKVGRGGAFGWMWGLGGCGVGWMWMWAGGRAD